MKNEVKRRRESIIKNSTAYFNILLKFYRTFSDRKPECSWKIPSSIKIHAVEICIDENEKWRNYFIDSFFLLNILMCILMSCDGNFAELINEYLAIFEHRHIFVSLARAQHCIMRFVRHLFSCCMVPRCLVHCGMCLLVYVQDTSYSLIQVFRMEHFSIP